MTFRIHTFFFFKKKVSFSCIFGQFRLSKAILPLR